MQAKQERRADDSDFWAWHRVYQTLCCDPTGVLSFWTGFAGFVLKGSLILLGVASLPEYSVQFLLTQLPIPLTEFRLAWSFVIGGGIQMLGIGTKNHPLRGSIALYNGTVSLLVTLAYMFSGLPDPFHAWVSYLGLVMIEGYLAWRNFNEQGYEEQIQKFVQKRSQELKSQ